LFKRKLEEMEMMREEWTRKKRERIKPWELSLGEPVFGETKFCLVLRVDYPFMFNAVHNEIEGV